MKFILFTIFLITHLINQCQKNQNEFTVINIKGAGIYEKPSFDSEMLSTLPPGTIVIANEQIQVQEKFQFGTGFSLAGKWIKPKSVDGYIFSSDLTDKVVETGEDESGKPYINLRGKLKCEESEIKQMETPMGKFPKYFKYKYYENGSYSYVEWDGCFDHIYEYKDLAINEAYHQMISDYSLLMNGNQLSIPTFNEKDDTILKFEGEGATQDLTIEYKENGSILVSSYDCT